MQQPMNQPEPIGGQQAMTQQMVLCPVRFVYETQVLVQPGDQIQPNQTFFINPQNPPPWMQNRPTPAPMVYVQQVPNNMIQSVPHSIDQNQLYLQQNFANYQLRPHNMLTQNPQEVRPAMQLANIMPNMVQNVQQNIQTNERNINQNQNAGQMQANTQNVIRNQIRQMPTANNQQVELQRQVFMNVRPQMNQQMNMARPVMSINQFQNMQAMANMQNVQIQQTNVGPTFVHNIGQRPLPQNVNAVRPQMIGNNVMNVQPVAKIREIPSSEANKSVTNSIAISVPNVKNFAQNYNCRPIQPRSRYVENNASTPKLPAQHTPVLPPQHIPVQAAPTQYNPDRNNSHQTVTNIAANTTYLNNPNISRKRKSESPDEIHNKIAVNPTGTPIYKNLQQGIVITKLCNEMGTNTSPVHKPNNNAPILNSQMAIAENIEQINNNLNKNVTEAKPVNTLVQNENDKLIRNTVFTQARGRVLQDKISETLPQIVEIKPPEIIQNTTETTTTETQKDTDAKTQKDIDVKMTEIPSVTTVIEIKPEIVEAKKIEITEKVNFQYEIKAEDKINVNEHKIEAKFESIEPKEQITDANEEKIETTDKIVSKHNILTHVVDGYVIQESNFAFPIRKPLKEKTLVSNPKAESDSTDALKECMKEEMKNPGVDVQLLPFHYLLLNSDKKKEENVEVKNTHPFCDLPHAAVKSWTVEDLSSHLLKFDWKDTASVFQDHEIDGESLFLVSKMQLVNIGVSEENADVICEFVKS